MRLLFPTIPLPNPALEAATKAPWPVWAGSTTKPIRFAPMPKKAAVRLWHRARDFDRGTHEAGKHGGAVGHTALAVLHALIFDFLNYRTGRLDPSYVAIAHKAERVRPHGRHGAEAAARAGRPQLGAPVRRELADGRFVLEQETNAYAVLPASQWRGYRPPADPPAPAPGTWGDHPPLPSVIAQAAMEGRDGGDLRSVVRILAADPEDRLAAALARLGRAFMARDS